MIVIMNVPVFKNPNVKIQSSKQVQSSKFKSFWHLDFELDLTFELCYLDLIL